MQQRLIKERERHAWRLQNLIDAVNYCRQGWLKNPATGKIVAVNTLDGQKVLEKTAFNSLSAQTITDCFAGRRRRLEPKNAELEYLPQTPINVFKNLKI